MVVRNRMMRRGRSGALLGAAALVGGALALGTPAQAAPGDAFDPSTPVVFVSKGEEPTVRLFRQVVDGAGFADYDPEGVASNTDYNALAYNLDDNYLYAVTNAAAGGIPQGAVVRIGQEGTLTRVGTSTFLPADFNAVLPAIVDQGVYNPDDDLYYVLQSSGTVMKRISTSTGAQVSQVTLAQSVTAAGGGFDVAYAAGFFWSLNGNTIVRIEPTSGAVTPFTVTGLRADTGPAGAAWTFGNGNLGFSHNGPGTITQLAVTNAAGTPVFRVVSQTPGAGSGRNDGTNVPGNPVDLSLTKTAAVADGGGSVTYTLVVRNNGAGQSSGWVLDDDLPSGLSNPVVGGTGASSVVGGRVTVLGGPLANGATATVTITADIDGPLTDPLENTATVDGNELDPQSNNNDAKAVIGGPNPTTTTTAAPAPSTTLAPAPGTPTTVAATPTTTPTELPRTGTDTSRWALVALWCGITGLVLRRMGGAIDLGR